MRSEMTPHEQAVWNLVRRKRMHGVTFYRQRPIDQYIVDFYCPKARLVVEIDGGQHWEPDHAEADEIRSRVLRGIGLEVLRFSNRDVSVRLQEVGAEIYRVVGERLASFSNPP